MSQKKKAPTAATVDAKTENRIPLKKSDSCFNIISHSSPLCNTLLEHIPFGRENAIPAPELTKRAGYRHIREMTLDIAALRKSGEVILSATDRPFGYFLPADAAECERFVRSMYSRVREIGEAVAGAREYMRGSGTFDD